MFAISFQSGQFSMTKTKILFTITSQSQSMCQRKDRKAVSLSFARINGVIVETSSRFGFRTQTLSLLLKLGLKRSFLIKHI